VLTACDKGSSLSLTLSPSKCLVLHGRNGYSEKWDAPHQASYYVGCTRMYAVGAIMVNDEVFKVRGTAWFDHEKSYIPLNSPIRGWDWFALQFNDRTELMCYHVRTAEGVQLKFSEGTYVGKRGKAVRLSGSEFSIVPVSSWTSPQTGIVYPMVWRIGVPQLKIDVTVTPKVANQEVNSLKSTIITYWEGACRVAGTKNKKQITGNAYAELAGYDQRLLPKLLLALVR